MTIKITDPQLEERLRREATARGVTVDVVLEEALALYRRSAEWRAKAEESDRLLEEAANEISGDVPPLSGDDMSRKSIYAPDNDHR